MDIPLIRYLVFWAQPGLKFYNVRHWHSIVSIYFSFKFAVSFLFSERW